MRVAKAVRLLVAAALLAPLAAAPVDAEPVVHALGGGLHAYISDNDASCNSVFLVTPGGILVVDTGFDRREAGKLLAAIRKVSALPVRYIVNTHYHRDHQGGNGVVGPEAVVISTGWTRERTRQVMTEGAAPADLMTSASYQPASVTFPDRLSVHLGNEVVDIYHPGPAHTMGDALVSFPRQQVVVTGDVFLTNSSPAMDEGSVENWITALERILASPATVVVPGHFELASKTELQRFRDYLAALRDQVARMLASGASLEQVRRGIDMSMYARFRQYPQFRATFADNAEVIYRELSKRKAPQPQRSPQAR